MDRVIVEQAPPRNLLPRNRTSSGKHSDRTVWARALRDAGMPENARIVAVDVEWGSVRPHYPPGTLERFFGVDQVSETWTGHGRGRTILTLQPV